MGHRVALFTTHPIQYQVPWFRALTAHPDVDLTVYFETIPDPSEQGRGFGVPFTWDVPLMDGYEWHVAPKRHATTVQYLPGLVSTLRRARPDVILVAGWQTPYLRAAALVAQGMGIPAIGRGESSALKPRSLPIRLAHRAYLQLFDRFLTLGTVNADFYRSNGVALNQLHHAPACVSNQRFDRDYRTLRPRRPALRASFGIPDGATCFLFAGKLIEKKRPLDLLAALDRLTHAGAGPLHILVVGDGALRGDMQRRAASIEAPVTFTGFLNQTEISNAYIAADVLVLPSNYDETWGLVVNEAMIFETPAIVSDRVGCGPDLVRDDAGFIVPFADPSSLAAAMRRLMVDPDLRRAMGRQARRRVLNEYTVERAVAGTIQALRSIQRDSPRYPADSRWNRVTSDRP